MGIFVILVTIGIALGFGLAKDKDNDELIPLVLPSVRDPASSSSSKTTADPYQRPPPSNTILGNFSRAAVAIDGAPCAKIGA